MIEGLLFEIESGELKKMFEARARHHEKKAKYFADRAEKAEEDPMPADLTSNRSVVSAKRDFLRRAEAEVQENSRFKFMAEHLIEKEIYRLTWEDLQKLEIREVFE